MTDFPNGIYTYCQYKYPEYLPYYSTITWATGQPFAGSPTKVSTGNTWDWDRARSSYYLALTATGSQTRENYFASTFNGIGHVLHLVQDMAVPAHTRNDFTSHLKIDPVYGVIQPYENYVKIFPSLVNIADPTGNFPTFSSPSITKYWDTDDYTGSNPSASTVMGLAEYSNANFFSDVTIFKDISDEAHWFPYPAVSSVQEYDEVVDTNSGKKRTYLRKIGDGETVNHLAAGSWGYKFLPSSLKNMGLFLDDKCHEDYARKLLPRAVGYSAGLLDYFFRGNIDITVPSNGVYSMIDATQPGFNPTTAEFTSIKLKAKNTTPNSEEMTDGSIELVVKYKAAQADPFQSGPVVTTPDFFYIVVPEKNNMRSLSRTSYTELNFDLGQNSIPLYATDVYLQLVYHGRLGNEDGAVAVGFKDISEPTPIDFFNNMDKICINGSWYEAGSQEAIAQVDTNPEDGIANEVEVYAHDKASFYVKFAPYSTTHIDIWASPTVYDFKVPYLAAGNHIRASYILSDYQFDYSIYNRADVKKDPDDPWAHYDYLNGWIRTAIKRQKDYSEDSGLCGGLFSCYIDRYPEYSDHYPADGALVFYNFRGISLWWGGQLITINYPYPLNSQCSYDLL